MHVYGKSIAQYIHVERFLCEKKHPPIIKELN